jgi:hypothetical protein
VLVVADEAPGRVGGEGSLAGAGEAEEDRRVAVRPDVGGAVHREDALAGEQVVEHGEDGLLEFAGVAGAADEDHPPGEAQHDEGAGERAVARGVGLEFGGVEDGEARLERRQLLGCRANEHVPDEEHVPRVRAEEPDRKPVGRVRAAEQVLLEELLVLEVGLHVPMEQVEVRGREPGILLPPDVGSAVRFFHDELVLGRAAGVWRRDGGEGAAVGQLAFLPSDRVLDQAGGTQVRVDSRHDRRAHGLRRRLGAHLFEESSQGWAEPPVLVAARARSCASTTAMIARFTISSTVEPRCNT